MHVCSLHGHQYESGERVSSRLGDSGSNHALKVSIFVETLEHTSYIIILPETSTITFFAFKVR